VGFSWSRLAFNHALVLTRHTVRGRACHRSECWCKPAWHQHTFAGWVHDGERRGPAELCAERTTAGPVRILAEPQTVLTAQKTVDHCRQSAAFCRSEMTAPSQGLSRSVQQQTQKFQQHGVIDKANAVNWTELQFISKVSFLSVALHGLCTANELAVQPFQFSCDENSLVCFYNAPFIVCNCFEAPCFVCIAGQVSITSNVSQATFSLCHSAHCFVGVCYIHFLLQHKDWIFDISSTDRHKWAKQLHCSLLVLCLCCWAESWDIFVFFCLSVMRALITMYAACEEKAISILSLDICIKLMLGFYLDVSDSVEVMQGSYNIVASQWQRTLMPFSYYANTWAKILQEIWA